MANEKRRDGGRSITLEDDEWVAHQRYRGGRKKRFGLRITYVSIFRSRDYVYTNWYETERARENALAALMKNRGTYWWNRPPKSVEKVSR